MALFATARSLDKGFVDQKDYMYTPDPVLIGRYVVFSTEWLELVGNGRDGTVTRRQFQAWRDRVDRLYECYEKFIRSRSIERLAR